MIATLLSKILDLYKSSSSSSSTVFGHWIFIFTPHGNGGQLDDLRLRLAVKQLRKREVVLKMISSFYQAGFLKKLEQSLAPKHDFVSEDRNKPSHDWVRKWQVLAIQFSVLTLMTYA